jgi:GH24 family phage-related lysozyme (muramidase)
MSRSISSSQPTTLFRYSDTAVSLDREVSGTAARLAGTLQHFEATCRESGFRVRVSHLPPSIRSHAESAQQIDIWVQYVGQGFVHADSQGIIDVLRRWLHQMFYQPTQVVGIRSNLTGIARTVNLRVKQGGEFSLPAARILASARAPIGALRTNSSLWMAFIGSKTALNTALLSIDYLIFVVRTWSYLEKSYQKLKALLFPSPSPSMEPTQGESSPEPTKPAVNPSPEMLDPSKLQLDSDGSKLISKFEGLKTILYDDPAGHCTIGIGHLVHKGKCNGGPSEREFENGITEEEAYKLFKTDVKRYEDAVRSNVKVPLNQNQYNALVSFTYNLGIGAFVNSDLLKKLNSGDYSAVPKELMRFTHGGGNELPGLKRRREEEGALFSAPVRQPVVLNTPQIDQTTYSGTHEGVGNSVCSAAAFTMALRFFPNTEDLEFNDIADGLIDEGYLTKQDGLLSGDYLEKYVTTKRRDDFEKRGLSVIYDGDKHFDSDYLQNKLDNSTAVIVTVPGHYTLVNGYRKQPDGTVEYHMSDSYRGHWESGSNAVLNKEWITEDELKNLWEYDSNSGRVTLVSQKAET